jgi:hypothetical protein
VIQFPWQLVALITMTKLMPGWMYDRVVRLGPVASG